MEMAIEAENIYSTKAYTRKVTTTPLIVYFSFTRLTVEIRNTLQLGHTKHNQFISGTRVRIDAYRTVLPS